MRVLIRDGARWVIVTAGRAPTLLTDGSRFWKVDAPVVDAVNPIGSGDALAAGVAVALVRGQELPNALCLGVACAAANAQTAHAGHVDAASAQSLMRTIHAEQISPD
jgi:fructose-1-phosphate kinase PfkB-like protein